MPLLRETFHRELDELTIMVQLEADAVVELLQSVMAAINRRDAAR